MDLVSVSPSSGQTGTLVTLAGISLTCGGDRVVTVTLAGESATIKSQSESEIIVEAPSGSSQQSILAVSSPGLGVGLGCRFVVTY